MILSPGTNTGARVTSNHLANNSKHLRNSSFRDIPKDRYKVNTNTNATMEAAGGPLLIKAEKELEQEDLRQILATFGTRPQVLRVRIKAPICIYKIRSIAK